MNKAFLQLTGLFEVCRPEELDWGKEGYFEKPAVLLERPQGFPLRIQPPLSC